MKVYIGNEHIISPIGIDASHNFKQICEGISGVKEIQQAGFKGANFHLSLFHAKAGETKLQDLITNCVSNLGISDELLCGSKTKVIFSSTKGTLCTGVHDALANVLDKNVFAKPLAHQPLLISNACISGVLAIQKAAELIKAGFYSHVVVIGCDVLADFIVYGFESLFAMGDSPCKPYGKQRNGINLGEGCASVVLSSDKSIFETTPLQYLGGSSTNDANHISGPSRTGEGLFRSINKTLSQSGLTANDIQFISAHGTATVYNDEMEAIAFNRLGMENIPVNSLKGYYGHTLGAAGVIETIIAMQSLKNNMVIASKGFDEQGTTVPLNVIRKTTDTNLQHILKTASGFGGGNASIIIGKA